MLNSKRLSATVLALMSILGTRPLISNAQTKEQARPFYIIESNGKANVQGYTPAQVRHGYGFDQVAGQGQGQTIAIVDAFDDPTIEQDLATFSTTFNLPACIANSCLQKVSASSSNPGASAVWSLEIALDVEWAHAIAPQAKILLVEAASDHLDDLIAAVSTALSYNPSAVSMSWGGLEFSSEVTLDSVFVGSNAMFFAAAGDSGHGVVFPSASPYVVSVGGTTLHLNANGSYENENVWKGSGGGLSVAELEPVFQSTYAIPNDPLNLRGTPDVAIVGDPNSGIAVYNSGWYEIGGTSAGPPQWAALFAVANSMRSGKAQLAGGPGVLYDAARRQHSNYHDIINGADGNCGTTCKAQSGYDYATGLGTPQADKLIPYLVQLP